MPKRTSLTIAALVLGTLAVFGFSSIRATFAGINNPPASSGSSGGSGTPGGSDTQVQFNNAGAFGGDAGLLYNASNDKLSVNNITDAGAPVAGVAIFGSAVGASEVDIGFDANIYISPGNGGYAILYGATKGAVLNADSLASTDKTFTFPNQSGTFATMISGSGAPSSTPVARGQIYVDTSASKVYISTATASSTDWKIMN